MSVPAGIGRALLVPSEAERTMSTAGTGSTEREKPPADAEAAAPERNAFARATWVHATVKTREDVEKLCQRTGAPPELARHALDTDELSRVDRDVSGAMLVVLRAPSVRRAPRTPLKTTALSVVLTRGFVVTMASPDLDLDVKAAGAAVGVQPDEVSPVRVLVGLVLATADRFLHHLQLLDAAVTELEGELQVSLRNAELRGLLTHQKSLVHFRTALGSNMIMLERLARDVHVRATDEERELLDDAIVEMRQAAETAKVASDILGEMMDAFASIISNNLNVVMKFLAAITVILMVPTLVASFYGMNVPLPLAHHPAAFSWLIVGSILACVALAVAFVFRRWI